MNTEARTLLLTGGRAPVALEMVRFFARSGHRVLGAESSSQNLARSSRHLYRHYDVASPRHDEARFIKDLVEICEKENVDVLIPTCEEVFYLSRGLAEFEKTKTKVFVDRIEKLHQLHNKFLFNQLTAQTAHPGPLTDLVSSRLQAHEKRDLHKKQILKPVYSRFAAEVRVLKPGEGIPADLKISSSKPWVLQDFVEGAEICFYGISHDGVLTHSVCYRNSFRAGKGAGICFFAVERPDITQWARDLVRSLQYTGQISFDVISPSSEEFFPIECNPRATSGVHLLAESGHLQGLLEASAEGSGVGSPAQLALAMMLLGLPQVRSFSELKKWWSCFSSSRDVLKSPGDWRPLLGQMAYLIKSAWVSWSKGMSLLEATTEDIQWDGEDH